MAGVALRGGAKRGARSEAGLRVAAFAWSVMVQPASSAPAAAVGSAVTSATAALAAPTTRQLMLAMVASLGYMSVGLVRGFSSPGVPSMQERDPHLLTAPGAVSWVSSIPPMGACVGSLCAGPLLQRCGRRRTLLLSAPVALAAWSTLAAASSYGMLLGARLMTGFCAGLIIPSAQVYVSECARPSARGVLGSLPALFMSGGILLGYVMGAWLPWRWLAGVSAVCPGALMALLLPLPESPTWLAARGRREEADAALRWLRRPPAHADAAAGVPVGAQKWSWEALLRRSVLLPLALALALMVFQQLSGIDSVVFYTVEIFEAAGGGVPSHMAAIVVGTVQLASNAAALFFVDRAGRRPLLLASTTVSAASMAALGAYFYLLEQGKAEGLGALPLASLVIFMVGFSVGLCTLPYLMMAEMLPAAQRGALSSWAGAFNLGVMFLVIKTFHDLSSSLGEAGAFWVYSALCVVCCVFVLVFVPETKGRSLEEIQAYFEGREMLKEAPKRRDEEMSVGYQRDGDDCAIARGLDDKKNVKLGKISGGNGKEALKLTHEKIPDAVRNQGLKLTHDHHMDTNPSEKTKDTALKHSYENNQHELKDEKNMFKSQYEASDNRLKELESDEKGAIECGIQETDVKKHFLSEFDKNNENQGEENLKEKKDRPERKSLLKDTGGEKIGNDNSLDCVRDNMLDESLENTRM